jgi:ornithine cyclodeaminase/alanine dehydrogenase-like protein (mu-crystallin family)
MALMLTNQDVEKSLSVARCIEVLEIAYRELGHGRAANIPRCDILSPMPQEGTYHALKSMSGSVPALGAAAVRLDSDLLRWPMVDGKRRRLKVAAVDSKLRIAKENGLVLVYHLETGEPVALMQDGSIQRMRVAATAALAAKVLSRPESSVLGIFGSGWQARSQVEALLHVRPIQRIRVFSPNNDHRARFAAWVRERFNKDCTAVDEPEGVVRSADIVLCITNSMDPVFLEKWMSPGLHISTGRNGEVEEGVISRSDRVILNWKEVAIPYPIGEKAREEIPEFTLGDYGRVLSRGALKWEEYPLLSDVVAGKAPGRKRSSDITCFLSNIGIGIQFAAAGWAAYEAASEQGVGTPIPDHWLIQEASV